MKKQRLTKWIVIAILIFFIGSTILSGLTLFL